MSVSDGLAGEQDVYKRQGEDIVKSAFGVDFGVVETVAHFTAAKHFMPDVDFVIDIGGQDMKLSLILI